MAMADLYDDTLDIGVAVKQTTSEISISKPKKKKRKRKRSSEDHAKNNDDDDRGSGEIKKKKTRDENHAQSASSSSRHQAEEGKPQITVTMPPLRGMFVKERSNLPVYRHRSELCNLIANNEVVLVVAETVRLRTFGFSGSSCVFIV